MAILVGAASFAISYNTLRLEAVAVDAVADGWPSYLLPLILDGGVIAGSAVLWKTSQDRKTRAWFAYLFVSVLVLLSVVVNIAHAGPTPLAKIVAALPPLVLLGCLELVVLSNKAGTVFTLAPPAGSQRETAPVAAPPTGRPGQPTEPARQQAALTVKAVAAASAQAVEAAGTPDGVDAPAPKPAGSVAGPSVNETPQKVEAARKAAPKPRAASRVKDGPSNADRLRDMFADHLAGGGSPTDPSLSRAFSEELGVSPAYVRKVLGELRRTAPTAPVAPAEDDDEPHLAPSLRVVA